MVHGDEIIEDPQWVIGVEVDEQTEPLTQSESTGQSCRGRRRGRRCPRRRRRDVVATVESLTVEVMRLRHELARLQRDLLVRGSLRARRDDYTKEDQNSIEVDVGCMRSVGGQSCGGENAYFEPF